MMHVYPQDPTAINARLREAAAAVVDRLERKAKDQVMRKSTIEDRWLEDLHNYHARYDQGTETALKQAGKSRVYVGLTRAKTNAWAARLSDMLFPTDDRNWGIKPTPVPELQAVDPAAVGDPAVAQARSLEDEARRRAEAMQLVMEDQLKEARYQIKCRDVIHDAVVLGTGILKGPVVGGRTRRAWQPVADMTGRALEHTLAEIPHLRPDFSRVDPWSFFPDMSARTPDEWEFTFERHLYTRKTLRRLARMPGFDAEALRDLLRDKPRETLPDYVGKLRGLTDGSQDSPGDERYVVWEYHGELEEDDLKALGEVMGAEAVAGLDPLEENRVVVFFCQGRVLKLAPALLDRGDGLYSVFNFEKDDAGTFGFGVPYLMRDSQRALNAAWRMTLDNAALSSGPQIVVNRDRITPADGDWAVGPRKLWYSTERNNPVSAAFEVYQIESRQDHLNNILGTARQFIDDEISLPMVAQGETGTLPSNTATGMSMLMESANVVFRRVVRNFDDDLTTPMIRRLYDWNMQFSPIAEIKGDFEVDARGSSVLLVRQMQANNLMAMALQFAAHPVLGPLTKTDRLYRRLVQAHMLSADDIVKSEDEIAEEARQAQEAAQSQEASDAPASDPQDQLAAQVKQAELEIKRSELQLRQVDQQLKADQIALERFKAETEREVQIAKVTIERDLKLRDQEVKSSIKAAEIDSAERRQAAETAVKMQMGSGL